MGSERNKSQSQIQDLTSDLATEKKLPLTEMGRLWVQQVQGEYQEFCLTCKFEMAIRHSHVDIKGGGGGRNNFFKQELGAC